MAVTQTGAMYKSLTFDNKTSREYGVYITGEAVYNAPERAVEMISIPGRNGAFALDQGRFENIEVSYPAGIFAENETDFAQAVSDFRNFLCSKRGYCRLTDEYNPNEYRMAVYKSGLEVDPAQLRAGEFTITFECKPQRWLTDGETPIDIGVWGDTETETGSIVTIEADDMTAIKDLTADIEPIQSGSGDPSPSNVRPISGHTDVVVVRTNENLAGDDGHQWNINSSGVIESNNLYNSTIFKCESGQTYRFKLSGGDYRTYAYFYNYPKVGDTCYGSRTVFTTNTLTVTAPIDGYCVIRPAQSETVVSVNKGNDILATAEDTEIKTIPLGTTVYGGTLDVTTGVLTVTHGNISSYNGETLPSTWISDRDVYASGTTPTTGAQVVYELATPTTTTLTAQQISLLLGQNNIWASSGDVTVEFGNDPNKLLNPTMFDASPLLEVEGYGDINIGSQTVTVNNSYLGMIPVTEAYDSGSFYINSYVTPYAYKTIKLDVSDLVSGDSIYVNNFSLSVIHTDSSYTITNISNATSTNTKSFGVSIVSSNQSRVVTVAEDTELVYGTASNSLTWSYLYYTNHVGGTSTIHRMNLYFSYDGNDTITFYSSNGAGTSQITLPAVMANSTKSVLGSQMFIDLDIGEAYKVENGVAVSINNIVEIPPELPVLPSGTTAITYDNTYTKLEITPRWWKI